MVRLGNGSAKNGQEFIAHVLFEHALIGEDLFGHSGIVFAQKLDHLMGSVALRMGRKPLQVAKQDRQGLFLAPELQPSRLLEHFLDHHWGHVMHESPFDFVAFPLLSDVMIYGQRRIIDRQP